MSVACESPCYQEKRVSVLVSNPFTESAHFRVLLIEVTGGFPGYGPPMESISSPQGAHTCMCAVKILLNYMYVASQKRVQFFNNNL